MNSEIETIFSNFSVNNVTIPVEFAKYDGDSEVYIVYFSNGETPELNADDKVIISKNTYDFNIYTKGNYLNILNEVKKKLNANGWTWLEDSEDIYEEDTRFFHKVTTWIKERNDFEWQESA